MKLELALLAGEESKQFLMDLTKQIDRLEKLWGGKPLKDVTPVEESKEADDDEDDDFETKPAKKEKKAAKSFDDDDDEETEDAKEDEDDEETEDDEDEEKPAKKGKPGRKKKITIDDVNDACKAYARAHSRADALKILKKKFKVESVTDLKVDQYEALIEAMAIEE